MCFIVFSANIANLLCTRSTARHVAVIVSICCVDTSYMDELKRNSNSKDDSLAKSYSFLLSFDFRERDPISGYSAKVILTISPLAKRKHIHAVITAR